MSLVFVEDRESLRDTAPWVLPSVANKRHMFEIASNRSSVDLRFIVHDIEVKGLVRLDHLTNTLRNIKSCPLCCMYYEPLMFSGGHFGTWNLHSDEIFHIQF